MNKDKNWLLREVRKLPYETEHGFTKIKLIDMFPLIHQLDEPEKIVIPQFVADWWEHSNDWVAMYGRKSINKKLKFRIITEFYDRGLDDHLSKVEDWLNENDSTFLDLVNGKPYEVEEEKKYYVDLKTAAYVAKWNVDNQVGIYTDAVFGSDEFEFHLTEKEIKDYDERYWPFAVEVEE